MFTPDQGGDIPMNTPFFVDHQKSLIANAHSLPVDVLKEQFCPADDSSPKPRKQYTISKQREKWSIEEHEKFLESLKLYGRAWRRIEEHVGSKTAVQIRSHAQKYFSKVVRESSNKSADSIEIPLPRPKRKPMHPYPRKVVNPIIKRGPVMEVTNTRCGSPNLSISEQENQSPMSVLSDALPFVDSNSRTTRMLPLEQYAASSLASAYEGAPLFQENQKFELFPASTEEAIREEEESSRWLRLFGRSFLVSDSDREHKNAFQIHYNHQLKNQSKDCTGKCMKKGFKPYKRCEPSDKDTKETFLHLCL